MTHHHLSAQSLIEFESEIEQTEATLLPYKNMRKWFRYPFLDDGNRIALGGLDEKMSQSLALLAKLGYTEGYVTINYEALKHLYLNDILQKPPTLDCEATSFSD